jgi:hypothetical protein
MQIPNTPNTLPILFYTNLYDGIASTRRFMKHEVCGAFIGAYLVKIIQNPYIFCDHPKSANLITHSYCRENVFSICKIQNLVQIYELPNQ